ncbi:MAG: RNA polymerase sigma factor [Myxococcota bacterium]|nr:RNA polymerase sigma factor [Myxococcota bacterium]
MVNAATVKTEREHDDGSTRVIRPLRVHGALARCGVALQRRLRTDRSDVLLAVSHFIEKQLCRDDVDSVSAFEDTLNGSLDLGYRGPEVVAFIFEVLSDRFAARVYRRLSSGGRRPHTTEVEDLVSVTVEAVNTLIANANRERHTLTYALLLSIADHRSIDYLRRKKADLVDDLDTYHTRHAWSPAEADLARPDYQLERSYRIRLARRLRTAILKSVNELERVERGALILVEVDGLSYDEIATRLDIKRTDVGNIVRRARLKRDRYLMPLLRQIEQLEGHIGFKEIQADRNLRLNLLRWTTEMGDGVCAVCADRYALLHTAEDPCFHGSADTPESYEPLDDVAAIANAG